jgi:hypothetical protein
MRASAFVSRGHRLVMEYCDALLARPLDEDERSRLTALRAAAEAALRELSGAPR